MDASGSIDADGISLASVNGIADAFRHQRGEIGAIQSGPAMEQSTIALLLWRTVSRSRSARAGFGSAQIARRRLSPLMLRHNPSPLHRYGTTSSAIRVGGNLARSFARWRDLADRLSSMSPEMAGRRSMARPVGAVPSGARSMTPQCPTPATQVSAINAHRRCYGDNKTKGSRILPASKQDVVGTAIEHRDGATENFVK